MNVDQIMMLAKSEAALREQVERLTAELDACKQWSARMIGCERAVEERERMRAERDAMSEVNARFAKRNLADMERMFVLEQERDALRKKIDAAYDAIDDEDYHGAALILHEARRKT